MTNSTQQNHIGQYSLDDVADCRFAEPKEIEALGHRTSPYWHRVKQCRHLGIHKPDHRICNWTARILTKDKRYIQRCLGPALDTGRGSINLETAALRAFEWFETGEVKGIANHTQPIGRTRSVNFCPIGGTYTVGHALRDYTEWTKIARSEGGHYNNLMLINHHLVPKFIHIPLENFNARNLRNLAIKVLETPPKFGFSPARSNVTPKSLSVDEVRKRKRTFNSLVTILRMAFRHAWDSGYIESERPWRCLKRISVVHSPRKVFLTREECRSLIEHCTPARQLGHANTRTVTDTYGHFAEHHRERIVRKCFSTLSDTQRQKSQAMRGELDQLWQTVQPADWRDYAKLTPGTSRPLRSIVQTNKEVLEVFDQVAS